MTRSRTIDCKSALTTVWLVVSIALLAGCGTGGTVRRVSEPAASLQQVTVRADGRWDVQLRLNNFSSVPMRFVATNIQIAFDNGAAASVQVQPLISIGPESADVVSALLTPTADGRARIATALADGRTLNYTLSGTLEAGPGESNARTYKIERNSSLTPVPGLSGVLR
ncbi:MAG: DUF1439 domain-containing protein [Pseudomonadota bacterium]|nr:DUF1439 domain-containing protein [Pseudomonadota bacterium]